MAALQQNERWRWLTAGAVGISLLAFTLLIVLLIWQGMRYFWPQPLTLYTLQHQQLLLGETRDLPSNETGQQRFWVRAGAGDAAENTFRELRAQEIVSQRQPPDVIALQRRSVGMTYGWFVGLQEDNQLLTAQNMQRALQQALSHNREILQQAERLRRVDMARLNGQLEDLQSRMVKQADKADGEVMSRYQADRGELERQFGVVSARLQALTSEAGRTQLLLRDTQGVQHTIPLADINAAWYPNAMSLSDKFRHFASQWWHFVSDSPSAGQAEGGVFPAIFGTVLMVILMSIIVMPLGVVCAVWLHEYAGNNVFTRIVRIAVVNLAGVPSIVYGVFGLGFFVWLMGGTLDQLFFSDALPNPTFGTPGLLWAALTLALLTLPVVIVATEEGLSRIPASLRQGAMALGATRAETLWHITLPQAVPAMLTGLILAVARAAGETAPLMLVGVVKSVPELPVDAVFPYLHLDRKFMHLGFQIYDLAFQNPNAEAQQPLVYATALLLVMIILGLNMVAMGLRHRLRERYRTLT